MFVFNRLRGARMGFISVLLLLWLSGLFIAYCLVAINPRNDVP